MARDQFADQWHHAYNDLLFAMMAIDVMRVGPGADDLAQDREAAEARVEDENCGRG